MNFFLGTHHADWLGKVAVPLFLSARRLRYRKNFTPARAPWALDSGGFSELQLFGRWETTPLTYAREVQEWSTVAGRMEWAAIQDWMCEPFMLARTGLTIAEHQQRSVNSMMNLQDLAPEIPWAPVLQGFAVDDYLRHVELYGRWGVNLWDAPVVGVGSVCRRQHTDEAANVFHTIFVRTGLPLHGFGLKVRGLLRVAPILSSADSLAWSFAARRQAPLPGHESRHKNCANCVEYALRWRDNVLGQVENAHGNTLGLARVLA